MAVRARAQHCTAIRQAITLTPSTKSNAGLDLLHFLIMIHVIITFLMRSEVGLPRAAVLGILGGGQLGKMLAADAVRPSASAEQQICKACQSL